MKIDHKQKNEFIKFCLAGCIVTATDFSVYYVLYHFFSYNLAKGISFTCAGILGYILYKYWIFKNEKASIFEMFHYAFINSVALVINVFINHSILSHWHGAVLVALITATSITGLLTYVSFKWWVFKAFVKENERGIKASLRGSY